MPTKGVFFDLFGTLLIYGDTTVAWSDWVSAFHSSICRFGLSMSKETFACRYRGLFARPEPPPRGDGLTVHARRLRAFCTELGLDLTPDVVRRTARTALEAWQQHISLDPEALPVLRALRETTPLALVTDFDDPPHVRSLLSDLRLAPFFAAVVISGEVGVKKPSPDIFAPALARTGLAPQDVLYVGDTAKDVEGARAAGLRPVLIRRPRADGAPLALDLKADGRPLPASDPLAGPDPPATISALTELLGLV